MGKYHFQIMPVSLFDIPALENWLSELASKGLYPAWLEGEFAILKEGEPQNCRFLLEPCGKNTSEVPSDLAELYQENGWDYVDAVFGNFYLFRSQGPDTADPHTDPVIRGLSLERLDVQMKRGRRRLWFYRLFVLFVTAFAIWGPVSRFDVQPAAHGLSLSIWLLFLTQPAPLILLLGSILGDWNTRVGLRSFRQFRAYLSEGVDPPEPVKSSGIHWRNLALLFLLLLAIPFLPSWLFHRNEIPLKEFSRPYLSLEELENEPLADWDTLFGESSFHENENLATWNVSLLAPLYYETYEHGYSTAPDDTSGFSPKKSPDYCYSPSLKAAYFRLLLPAMARSVAKAKMNELRIVNLVWYYEEISCPDTDFFLLAEASDGIWQMAAVAKGGRVAVFRYGGAEKLRDHTELLASFVQ